MEKRQKLETLIGVLIPVLVFLLLWLLAAVLWTGHDPSGGRGTASQTESQTGTEQQIAVAPVLIIETEQRETPTTEQEE